MKAAVLYEHGQPLIVEEVDLAPPRAGEVRVRVAAAGVCHSDYHFMRGDLTGNLPCVLLWRTSCGECEYCSSGRPNLCPSGAALRWTGRLFDGTSRLSKGGHEVFHFMGVSCFAEEVVCSERAVLKVPDSIPLQVAALVGCSVMTGVGAVTNTARVEPGSTVLVIGAGGVGLCAIMGAALAGAARIIAADVNPTKLELATSFGATDVIDGSQEDVVAAAQERTGGGVDYAFEVIGLATTVNQAVRALSSGGTAVAIGVAPQGAEALVPLGELVSQEKTLKGSIYGSTRPQKDFPRLFDLYQRGRLPLDRLVTREWSLAEVNQAYEALLAGTVARSVLVP